MFFTFLAAFDFGERKKKTPKTLDFLCFGGPRLGTLGPQKLKFFSCHKYLPYVGLNEPLDCWVFKHVLGTWPHFDVSSQASAMRRIVWSKGFSVPKQKEHKV